MKHSNLAQHREMKERIFRLSLLPVCVLIAGHVTQHSVGETFNPTEHFRPSLLDPQAVHFKGVLPLIFLAVHGEDHEHKDPTVGLLQPFIRHEKPDGALACLVRHEAGLAAPQILARMKVTGLARPLEVVIDFTKLIIHYVVRVLALRLREAQKAQILFLAELSDVFRRHCAFRADQTCVCDELRRTIARSKMAVASQLLVLIPCNDQLLKRPFLVLMLSENPQTRLQFVIL